MRKQIPSTPLTSVPPTPRTRKMQHCINLCYDLHSFLTHKTHQPMNTLLMTLRTIVYWMIQMIIIMTYTTHIKNILSSIAYHSLVLLLLHQHHHLCRWHLMTRASVPRSTLMTPSIIAHHLHFLVLSDEVPALQLYHDQIIYLH